MKRGLSGPVWFAIITTVLSLVAVAAIGIMLTLLPVTDLHELLRLSY